MNPKNMTHVEVQKSFNTFIKCYDFKTFDYTSESVSYGQLDSTKLCFDQSFKGFIALKDSLVQRDSSLDADKIFLALIKCILTQRNLQMSISNVTSFSNMTHFLFTIVSSV